MPNKPAKVKIWHYQATVITIVEDTASYMKESIQTASIALEWADLVQKFNQPTVICIDGYYLDNVERRFEGSWRASQT